MVDKAKMKNVFDNNSITKLMVVLCVPAMITMLIHIIYNLADTFFIGKLNNPLMVSALSIASPMFAFIQAFNLLICGGVGISIGIALGEKNYDKIKRITSFGFYSSLLIGVIIAIAININPYAIARLLGAKDSFIEYTVDYIRVIAYGGPFVMLSGLMPYIIKSDGSSMQATLIGLLGTILNIILDPILILVFKMECIGAALATILGYGLSTILGFIYVIKQKDKYSFNIKYFTLNKEIALATILLGIPQALSTILNSVSSTIANNYLVSYGDIVVAANGIAHKASYIILMICMGVNMGLQPAMSYYYGNKNMKKLNSVIKASIISSITIGSVLTVFFLIFRNQFINLFIKDEQLLSYGKPILLASLITGPIIGLYQVATSFLQATGKVSYATLSSILRQGLIYLPSLILLNTFFGFYGCIYSGAVSNVLSILLISIFCFDWHKKIKVKFNTLDIK